jgi:hypothetical protein
VAGRRIIVVIEAVVPKQLFAGSNVTESEDPHPVLDFIDLAVGIAGMV